IFKLYDTYGFPKELTEEYVKDYGLTIDEDGFENEMDKQRNRARAARENVGSMHVQNPIVTNITDETTFIGYAETTTETNVLHIVTDHAVKEVQVGETAMVILQSTPFYAESGGQTADVGWIVAENGKAKVTDVQTAPNGQHLHQIEVKIGRAHV